MLSFKPLGQRQSVAFVVGAHADNVRHHGVAVSDGSTSKRTQAAIPVHALVRRIGVTCRVEADGMDYWKLRET